MSTLADLKKIHGDSMNAVQVAERDLDQVKGRWKAAIAAGANDTELDNIDLDRMRAERAVERRRVAEQQSHDAVVAAEKAEAEQEKKQAADDFLKAYAGLQYELAKIDELAGRFVEAVNALPEGGGVVMQTLMRAKYLGALPSVTPLAPLTDAMGAARKAANYAGFISGRMN